MKHEINRIKIGDIGICRPPVQKNRARLRERLRSRARAETRYAP